MKDKEEIFLKNRLLELSDKAAMRNVATHSVFLNLYEQTVLGLIQNSFSNVNMKISIAKKIKIFSFMLSSLGSIAVFSL